ncbi:uncharacterized protein LOC133182592 [Saccostrea echinata]|uniref:uncharacterized protein LOC133182592 n=1 Tax=Saccostrea echinata TaxID=191078 RepID=UPI002A80F31A|nr:uncharacterized protein LOC133182592 [Saccostrea echinata]
MKLLVIFLKSIIIAQVCGQIPVESPTDFLTTGNQIDTTVTRTIVDRRIPSTRTAIDMRVPATRTVIAQPLPVDVAVSAEQGRPLQLSPDGQCPTFLSRYEGDILVINLVPGTCDMLIFVQDQTHLFPAAADVLMNTGAGRIRLPMVTFRGNSSTNSIATGCPMIPLRYLGPRVVLDTIPGRCQIVLGIRTFPILGQFNAPGFDNQLPLPGEPRWVTRAVFERTSGIL